MDLSRWGLRKFSHLTDRYHSFREFLGDVLEGERTLLPAQNSTHVQELPFAVSNEVERLLQSPLPSRGNGSIRIETVFENFASFFEAGFLLKTAPESPERLLSMFLFGRVFVPPESEGSKVILALPRVSPHQVVRGRVGPVLQAFHLGGIESLKEASVFAIAPIEGTVFLFICNRPHPWQVDVIETTHRVIRELFDREPKVSNKRISR